MRVIKYSVLLLALFASQQAQSVPLNATQIGSVWTTTPVAETAFQALQGFRGAFTPINIGMAVGTYVIISTIGDGINSLRAQMAAPLTPAASPAGTVPAGWANTNTPPATATATTLSYFCDNNCSTYPTQYSTSLAAANAGCARLGAGTATGSNSCGVNCSGSFSCSVYPYGTSVQYQSSITCPNGYTLSGSDCNLTSSASVQWPSDGVPTVTPINGVLTPHPRDPDNSGISSGTISRTGTDEYGNPVSETITTNSQNGIEYKRDTQSINSTTGEPVIQRDQYTTDSSGQVTSSTSNIYNNSTVSNVTTTSPSIDTSALAKDTTLAQAVDNLYAIDQKLITQPWAVTDPDAPRTIADSNTAVVNAFTAHLPAVTMSDDVPECPTFSAVIPYLNFTMTIDQYCTLDQYIRPVLNIAAFAAYTLMGLIIVMRA